MPVQSQIRPREKYLQTIKDTMWLYPTRDILAALAITTFEYTFDGINIICPDMTNFIGVYLDIFAQTAISQPDGNIGFSLGIGTMLRDLGKVITFQLPGGQVVVRWRLVQQITPQNPGGIINNGNSPADTIGYVTTFTSYGNTLPDPLLDPPYVVRVG